MPRRTAVSPTPSRIIHWLVDYEHEASIGLYSRRKKKRHKAHPTCVHSPLLSSPLVSHRKIGAPSTTATAWMTTAPATSPTAPLTRAARACGQADHNGGREGGFRVRR